MPTSFDLCADYLRDSGYRPADPSRDVVLSLEEFLCEPGLDYSTLIYREKTRSFKSESQADHASIWLPNRFDIRADTSVSIFIRERMKGAPLIDVGGGQGKLDGFAAAAGASAYINVDLYPSGFKIYLDPKHNLVPPHEAYLKDTQRLYVAADMLDFLSRVPSHSSNIMINGIDVTIIKTPGYNQVLAAEIARVTKPNGIVLGWGSDCLAYVEESLHDHICSKKHWAENRIEFNKNLKILALNPAAPPSPLNNSKLHEKQTTTQITTSSQAPAPV